MRRLPHSAPTPRNVTALAILTGWLLCASGCGSIPEPAALDALRGGEGTEDFDTLLERSVVESERFRRRLIARRQNRPGSDADLVARAIVEFRRQAPQPLDGRVPLSAFYQDVDDLVRALEEGQGRVLGEEVFGAFRGKWFGRWDGNDVDHHWGRYAALHPAPVFRADENSVRLDGYQFAWIGDGYGFNHVCSVPGNPWNRYILGYVVHVKDGNLAQETARRPHVGVDAGPGRIIWITAGEVFLEESFIDLDGSDAYAITGFFYRLEGDTLTATRAFQTVYTRKAHDRPTWFSFSVNIRVARET